MITTGLVFAALAAVLHVYIFTMESLTWTTARTRATFGTTPGEAEVTKLLAFNQGFYNLFLAIVTGIGIVAVAFGHQGFGAALVFAGVGSMAAAAVVLRASSPDKARAALTQGIFPVIAIVLLVIGLLRRSCRAGAANRVNKRRGESQPRSGRVPLRLAWHRAGELVQ